jgi:hypothetical protein
MHPKHTDPDLMLLLGARDKKLLAIKTGTPFYNPQTLLLHHIATFVYINQIETFWRQRFLYRSHVIRAYTLGRFICLTNYHQLF